MLSVKSRTSWSSIRSGSSALSRIAFTFARMSWPIRPRIDDCAIAASFEFSLR
jgi:hypothetical protein